jgi:thiamine biosynthesis lipoprotein ApbE
VLDAADQLIGTMILTGYSQRSELGRASALAPCWRIGVEDPRDPGRLLGTFALGSGAVATSGITRRGNHIVDPATGDRPTTLLSRR